MIPLRITATLRGGGALPNGPIMLDSLLGAAICTRDGIPPAHMKAELVPLDIPIAKSPCGRVYLCSASEGVIEANEARFVNRKFPIAEAQALAAPSFKRIQINGGPCKSYRLPLVLQHYEHDQLRWWAIGDEHLVRALLALIGYLGKRRAVGHGPVAQWDVEPCEPWGHGFPVVREGQPTRPLPTDWPELAPDVEQAYRVLLPPYWRREDEELCVVPRWVS